jgi:hypothetical protein
LPCSRTRSWIWCETSRANIARACTDKPRIAPPAVRITVRC